jgi:hypothetical protein
MLTLCCMSNYVQWNLLVFHHQHYQVEASDRSQTLVAIYMFLYEISSTDKPCICILTPKK